MATAQGTQQRALRPVIRRPVSSTVVGGARNGVSTGIARPLPQARPLAGWGVVRRRISRLMLLSLALLLVAALGVFQVLQTSRVASVGYTLRNLEVERQIVEADIRMLEAQIASSSNLDHLRRTAETRLGMLPADETVRVRVGVPAPSTVPLPRRYVRLPEREPIPARVWWEHVLEAIPGLH
jgi:cell division protein FtsL